LNNGLREMTAEMRACQVNATSSVLPTPNPITARLQRALSLLVVRIGMRRRLDLIETRRARHADITDPELMAVWQTTAFNQIWRDATQRIRFYADWKARHGLPSQIKEIGELTQFPVLRRDDIDENFGTIAEDSAPCHFVYSGGTTGNSRRFPRGGDDTLVTYANQYLGRSWAGISPGDKIVSIWGHEHLFGSGRMGQIKKMIRSSKDWLIGIRRLNAYLLDEASVAAYFDEICIRPGSTVIAYVSAMRKLLDFVEQSDVDGRSAQIRAVILCGETVTARDMDRVRTTLGSVPLIEYGMMETGAMAYSTPQCDALTFIWDSFHCHAADNHELIVTSLQPMRFPLVNYGTEDRIEPLAGVGSLPFRCARISGRIGYIFQLKTRRGQMMEVNGELILNVLDVIPEVYVFEIRQGEQMLDISVQLAPDFELDVIHRRFILEIRREIPNLDESTITFSRLERGHQTIAGKHQVVVFR
jgi:phenylacetate-CoA ligase